MNRQVVGYPVARTDAVAKVTGQAKYLSDLALPNMAHALVLRSTAPHASITRMDTSQAEKLSGVLAVLTGANLGVIEPRYGPAFKDQPILAIGRVRYQGEPVAAVVAEDPLIAHEAAGLISVEYDELPTIDSLDEALAKNAPLLHDEFRIAGHFRDLAYLKPIRGTNICHHAHYERGRGASGLAQAEVVVEDEFHFPAIQHLALEPFVCLAQMDQDRVTVWSSTQHPFAVRKELSEVFGVPLSKIRVISSLIGGAFGSRCYTRYEPLTVALARVSGRPVRLSTSLSESFQTTSRHGARIRMRTGAKRDGTLIARSTEAWLDTGAYADVGPRVAGRAAFRSVGPYRFAHAQADVYAVHTNHVPAGAFRGYGGPQVAWAGECQIDRLAEVLSMDPADLRAQNLLRKGEEYSPGDTPVDGDWHQGLSKVKQAIGWGSALEPGRGRGIAFGVKDGGGGHGVSSAVVRLHADGSATVLAGSVEIGQGAQTVMRQVAAEVLGLPLDQVSMPLPDTDVVPFDQGSSGSRSTVKVGVAVQRAAEQVRAKLISLAEKTLEAPPEQIQLVNGTAQARNEQVTYAELVAGHFGMPGGELIGTEVFCPIFTSGPLGGAITFWEAGIGAAEIKVDRETGLIEILKYFSSADVGQAINPLACEGQEEGGAVMGMGHSLFESLDYQDGQLLNSSPMDYRVPLMSDLPHEFESILIQNGDGPGPFGAKGVGETGIVPVAPALANALWQATRVRVRDLPLTPERVWRALEERAANNQTKE